MSSHRQPLVGLGMQLSRLLPNPLVIAVLLTLLVFALAFMSISNSVSPGDKATSILSWWEKGLWNTSGLEFAMQAMLMLTLGHVLGLSSPFGILIDRLASYGTNTARAAMMITLASMLMGLFNWGLGLIFGAILARKTGELAARRGYALNYPILGAAAYSSMMIWHAGLSGSAPVKASEPGALHNMMANANPRTLEQLPELITINETIFSAMNITAVLLCLVLLPWLMMKIGNRVSPTKLPESFSPLEPELIDKGHRLDRAVWLALLVSGIVLTTAMLKMMHYLEEKSDLGFITPNFINLVLLGLAIGFHKRFRSFLQSLDQAIGGCAGILIQFPLYFGIMEVMKQSGLMQEIAEAFNVISNQDTFPLFTYVSAGITNIMVPSGGGQWVVQGPIILEGAIQQGVPLHKVVMALAYGDQITNMLQPFWALPLLGITGLRAKDILPYTLLLMFAGGLIYGVVLVVF
jgi:short-chain fatty acids transporter